jgi:nucleotide-binding universal stress UspA family protein
MAPTAIVSYDDTPNDHDALMLAQSLAGAGAELVLAFVRHATQADHERELVEASEARTLLERGARTLGDLDIERRVVVSPSTAEGIRWLAEDEHADIVVFGSDYRTAPGHVAPQKSAEALLEGGPAAVAIAPANYRTDHITRFGRIGVLAEAGDDSAIETARELGESLGARVTRDEPYVDLLVVGSRLEAAEGRVMISSSSWNAIENAISPVFVVPRGVTVRFPSVVAV